MYSRCFIGMLMIMSQMVMAQDGNVIVRINVPSQVNKIGYWTPVTGDQVEERGLEAIASGGVKFNGDAMVISSLEEQAIASPNNEQRAKYMCTVSNDGLVHMAKMTGTYNMGGGGGNTTSPTWSVAGNDKLYDLQLQFVFKGCEESRVGEVPREFYEVYCTTTVKSLKNKLNNKLKQIENDVNGAAVKMTVMFHCHGSTDGLFIGSEFLDKSNIDFLKDLHRHSNWSVQYVVVISCSRPNGKRALEYMVPSHTVNVYMDDKVDSVAKLKGKFDGSIDNDNDYDSPRRELFNKMASLTSSEVDGVLGPTFGIKPDPLYSYWFHQYARYKVYDKFGKVRSEWEKRR